MTIPVSEVGSGRTFGVILTTTVLKMIKTIKPLNY